MERGSGPGSPAEHPFARRPHRTLWVLTLPVLGSLVAEPLTGMVDTAFVARLGSAPAAALGVATALLSSLFWIFNFLGIGTQTELARTSGAADRQHARDFTRLVLSLGLGLGAAMTLVMWPWLDALAGFMGARDEVREGTLAYLRIRLLGSPAVLLAMAGFGALRGVQDMVTPLWVSLGVNLLNVLLDALLIFGAGPVPALGLAGAAWASTLSQWLGALAVLLVLRRRIGPPTRAGRPAREIWREAGRLFVTGRDLVIRTSALLLFMLLATRAATRGGAEAGAAHQAIRQIWLLTAFLLDAYAITAQTLVGTFLGASRLDLVHRVARVSCGWGLATGALLIALLLPGEDAVARLLVPPEARELFHSAWAIAVVALPLSALSFVTDGIHWGSADYRYLRNGMLAATGLGCLALLRVDVHGQGVLFQIWAVSLGWIGVRAVLGVGRIWPGFGKGPLAHRKPDGRSPGETDINPT